MCTTKSARRHASLGSGLVLLAGLVALPLATYAAGAHDEAPCATCHGGSPRTTARTDVACLACHGPDTAQPWGSPAFHGEGTEGCADCHVFHDPTLVILPGTGPVALDAVGSATSKALPEACSPCHGRGSGGLPTLSAAHQAAGAWYHSSVTEVLGQSISDSCLRCHDAEQELPDVLDAAWDPPRPHVEASHPFGVAVQANRRGGFGIRADIDPRLVLVDGRIECTTCHDIFEDENDMLVDLGSTADFCQGCHVRTVSPGFALAR